jgi:Spy/CpxP family protein refolding chaperone
MNKTGCWKVTGYAVVLFLLGGVCGAVLAPKLLPAQQTLKLGREKEIFAMMRDRLTAKLSLTADQEQKIEPMIQQASESLEASHRGCLKSVLEALDKMHLQIQPLLTPGQVAKLKELEAERSKSWLAKYNYAPETPAGH